MYIVTLCVGKDKENLQSQQKRKRRIRVLMAGEPAEHPMT